MEMKKMMIIINGKRYAIKMIKKNKGEKNV